MPVREPRVLVAVTLHCVRLLFANREVPWGLDENEGANAGTAFTLKEVAGFCLVGCCGVGSGGAQS